MELKTKFDFGQTVTVKELKKIGKVIAVFISKSGIEYSVRYFGESDAKTCYFFEDELEESTNKPVLGFQVNGA